VSVVHGDEQRTVVGQRAEQGLTAVVHTGDERRTGDEERLRERARTGERRGATPPLDRRPEQPAQQVVGGGGGQVVRPRPQDVDPAGRRELAGGFHKGGLALPRDGLDDHDASAHGPDLIHGSPDDGQFPLAFDQGVEADDIHGLHGRPSRHGSILCRSQVRTHADKIGRVKLRRPA
jgi:hypothetical protein